jgi:hypothetical protein
MRKHGSVEVVALITVAIFFAAGAVWYYETHSAPAPITQITSGSNTAVPQSQGCTLLPYTGTSSLSQLPYYVAGDPDFRGGMVCHFIINSKLPTFTFHFKGEPDNTMGLITITEGTGTQVIQTIDPSSIKDPNGSGWDGFDPNAIAPETYQDILVPVDANFDGYEDLPLLVECGATGNCSYDFYIYDPATNQFVYNDFLSGLGTFSIDSSTQEIDATWAGGSYCDGGMDTYKYYNATYTLIQETDSNCDDVSTTVSTYELRNGKMQLINATTTPTGT